MKIRIFSKGSKLIKEIYKEIKKIIQKIIPAVIEYFEKLKKCYEYIVIILLFIVATHYNKSTKVIIKDICIGIDKYYNSYNVAVTNIIKAIYLCIEKYILSMIVIEIILVVIRCLMIKGYDLYRKKSKNKGALAESLLDYLNNDNKNRSYLLTGAWGTGKTYTLNEFFEKYYSFSNKKIYKISCYGLDDRSKMANEINNMIKKSDNSIRSGIAMLLSYIPVLGEAFNIFIEKSYDYRSLKEGTILVFDDFERISADNVGINSKLLKNEKRYYGSMINESDTDRAVKIIDIGIDNISTTLMEIHAYDVKKKYAEILGFVNELIEVYGMKVIIVCDRGRINRDVYSDIVRNKLNSRVYQLMLSENRRISIINDMIKELPKQYHNMSTELQDFLVEYNDKLQQIIKVDVFNNLRNYSTILDAFVATAIPLKNKSEDFLLSLLNSIIMVHYCYYKESYNDYFLRKFLGKIEIGTNIIYECRKKHFSIDENIFVRMHSEAGKGNDVKWVGRNLAERWLKSLYDVNFDEVELNNKWKSYIYAEDEEILYKNKDYIHNMKTFRTDHVFYGMSSWSEENFDGEELYKLLELTLETSKVDSFSDVEAILEQYESIVDNTNDKRDEVIVEFLLEKYVHGECSGYSNIRELYNKKRLKTDDTQVGN